MCRFRSIRATFVSSVVVLPRRCAPCPSVIGRLRWTLKYPLRKMFRFATDGILSFSSTPLQLSVALGLLSAALALVGIVYALVLRVFTDIWVEGWTALMIAVLFIGGVQLISVGILGAYVGRIYNEIKRRPLYVVQERIGFDASDGA